MADTISADPGTGKNRLSLDPAQFPFIANWEDGMTYEATFDGNPVTLTQISAGEFGVETNAAPEAPEEQVEEVPAGDYPNPAIGRLGSMM